MPRSFKATAQTLAQAAAASVLATAAASATAQASPTPPTSPQASAMHIAITLDGRHRLRAQLQDNPSSRALLASLPLDLPLEDFAEEKIVRLPHKLSSQDAPASYRGQPGDITYYAPWGNLALFYGSGPNAPGLVYLGRFEGSYSPLRNARHIRIEAAP